MIKKTFIQVVISFFVFVCAVRVQADVAAPPILDPNLALFPRSSLHDFSNLVPQAPDTRGFLQAHDGHFFWQDGTRARFWGINVANHTLMVPDSQIVAMVKNFRQAGFNLIRLHHFDERNGIIDMTRNDSQHILEERLRKIDFWIYQAHLNGISIYLDLLDYRQFKEGDGVPNADAIGRAARPYAVFDPRLIELQKEYAKALLTHVNPYTKLAYVDDPTVVMLEMYDESGLLMRRAVWRSMPAPYNHEFQKMWNQWLLERYKNTSALRAAWGESDGNSVLGPDENLENGSVELPLMTWTPQSAPEAQRFYAALPRRNDGARFAVWVHQRYFQDMRDYLRGLGVKIPITATGRFDDLADLKSLSSELDFIGANFYYDHPYWATGKPAWQLPSYFHGENPLQDSSEHSFAATLGLAKIHDKPLVVREWNYCWPNPGRGAGMLEAASYADFQDIDAMILFTYETSSTASVSYFNVRSDPARWGLCGVAAQIFLKQLIPPSRYKVIIPYSDVDTFTYTSYYQPLYALGWFAQLQNDFYDTQYQAPGSAPPGKYLLVTPGRSAGENVSGAPAVLWQQGEIPSKPVWRMQQKQVQLGTTTSRQALATSLDALQQFYDAPFSGKVLLSGQFASDGGRLMRDERRGTQFINTSQVQAMMGNLGGNAQIGALKVRGLVRGVLVMLSLDGLPIGQSQHFVLKMVSDARNVDQAVKRDPRFLHLPDGQWMVQTYGKGPVTEDGRQVAQPLEVWRGNQLLVKIYQQGGSFELLMKNGTWKFFSDTPQTRFAVYGSVVSGKMMAARGKTIIRSQQMQAVLPDGRLKSLSGLEQGNAVIARFPQGAAYVQFPVQ